MTKIDVPKLEWDGLSIFLYYKQHIIEKPSDVSKVNFKFYELMLHFLKSGPKLELLVAPNDFWMIKFLERTTRYELRYSSIHVDLRKDMPSYSEIDVSEAKGFDDVKFFNSLLVDRYINSERRPMTAMQLSMYYPHVLAFYVLMDYLPWNADNLRKTVLSYITEAVHHKMNTYPGYTLVSGEENPVSEGDKFNFEI